MKILICGLGSIGRRHANNLLNLKQKNLIFFRERNLKLRDKNLTKKKTYTSLAKALNENPDQYDVRDVAVQGSTGVTTSPTSYGFEYNPYAFSQTPFQTVAEGGEIFPRRVGGIMPNEGIPDKDSVRAMLMPGEFVMTTDAVKGLGGGDMNKGISNMYGVMRNLEQRGKAMA